MDKVKADLDKAEARFTLLPRKTLEVARVREAVKKAGYSPTWMAFTATGVLAPRDGGWAVKVKDSGQIIPLEENEALQRLRAAGASGKLVTVSLKIPAGKELAVVETFTIP